MLKKAKSLSFGSSVDNPSGLKIQLQFDEDTRTAYGTNIVIPSYLQGSHTEKVHPGILATMLDEVMTYINHSMNLDAHIGELTIRYLQPASTNENLHLRGYFVKKNKRIIENRAEIEDDIGKIVARAKGKYIEIEHLNQK